MRALPQTKAIICVSLKPLTSSAAPCMTSSPNQRRRAALKISRSALPCSDSTLVTRMKFGPSYRIMSRAARSSAITRSTAMTGSER